MATLPLHPLLSSSSSFSFFHGSLALCRAIFALPARAYTCQPHVHACVLYVFRFISPTPAHHHHHLSLPRPAFVFLPSSVLYFSPLLPPPTLLYSSPFSFHPPPTSPHPLCLRPSAPGSINIPENESRLQRRFVRERRMYDATHSPVRVQGKLRRSRICTGTVHQRRPPSRTRPATETENMGAIVLRPSSLSFSFFLLAFFLAFLSFLSVSFPGPKT